MASVVISGDTSGAVTITAPAVAGTPTLTLPTTTDTLVGKATTDTLTNKTLTSPTISGAVVSSMNSSVITSGTTVASTSGTSIDFTSLPTWVKRITVMFNGTGTNGASNKQIQLGTSSGVVTSGYKSTCSLIYGSNTCVVDSITSGFLMRSDLAADELNGHYVFTSLGSNIWIGTTVFNNYSNSRVWQGAGQLSLGGTLDRVRITTVNGTDTFDTGSINIIYE